MVVALSGECNCVRVQILGYGVVALSGESNCVKVANLRVWGCGTLRVDEPE